MKFKTQSFKVHNDTVDAILYWYALGMTPGSYAYHIINQNHEGAMESAHPNLLSVEGYNGPCVVDDMLLWFRTVYPWFIMTGTTADQWLEMFGLQGATSQIHLEHKLSMIDRYNEGLEVIERYGERNK